LGGIVLPQLTPGDIQRCLDDLRSSGKRNGQPLSARTVQYSHTVLNMALSYAVRPAGFIPRNPMVGMDRPAAQRPEMRVWTAETAGDFLAGTIDDRFFVAWLLFLTRGFRRGEVAGMRWSDFDIEGGRVSVLHTRIVVDGKVDSSTPKTARGRRSVPLDADLVRALRAHRKAQLVERASAGLAWTDTGYVFVWQDGRPPYPEYFSSAFERHTLRLGLPHIRLHDTRHTAATVALRAGVRTEIVSRWLGHHSSHFTADVYQHEVPSLMEEAGQRVTSLILRGNIPLTKR
jgi:integrase